MATNQERKDQTMTYKQIHTILINPATSYWLRTAIQSCEQRDIVDAINDVEVLMEVLKFRLNEIQNSIKEGN